MPLRPAKRTRTCTWARRKKASACTVSNFPWEIVISHLKMHPRSLILLQMVDKNLNNVLVNNHVLWLTIYKKYIYRTAFCQSRVMDHRYPGLMLFKSGLTGLAIHTGALKGDVNFTASFAFEESFTSYARRVFALKFGTRCGMCGYRHRNDVYWSLGMRVCRLCFGQNTISSTSLFYDYGIYFYELANDHPDQIFYCQLTPLWNEARIHYSQIKRGELDIRVGRYMIWKPHLDSLVDLPAKYQEQKQRRAAVNLLSSVIKRKWITQLRHRVGSKTRPSAYLLVNEIYTHEKKRVMNDVGNEAKNWTVGGGGWSFFGRYRGNKNRSEVMHKPEITNTVYVNNVYRGVDKVPRID